MRRVFRRGELKGAVLSVLITTGPANGYTIMQRLAEEVGGGWRPSPGAIYPALIALEDAGHIESSERDGSRTYRLTAAGRAAGSSRPGLLAEAADRAADLSVRTDQTMRTDLGRVIDSFSATVPDRTRTLTVDEASLVTGILTDAWRRITTVLDQGGSP